MADFPEDVAGQQADLVKEPSKAPPAPNPFASSANVTISVPETVEVRLVDASVLADYEVWLLVASILSSAAVGFLVAFFQASAGQGGTLLAITVVFALLFLVAVATAFRKRRKLSSGVKRLRFRVGEQIQEPK